MLLTLRLIRFAIICYIKWWLLPQGRNSIRWLTFDCWYHLCNYHWHSSPFQISRTCLFDFVSLQSFFSTWYLECSFLGVLWSLPSNIDVIYSKIRVVVTELSHHKGYIWSCFTNQIYQFLFHKPDISIFQSNANRLSYLFQYDL